MLDRKVYDAGMVHFFLRYPNAKAEEKNLDAWYEDVKEDLSNEHFTVVIKYLAKHWQYQSWQNFGGIILDTSRTVKPPPKPEPLQIVEHLGTEELAERRRILAEHREILSRKFTAWPKSETA